MVEGPHTGTESNIPPPHVSNCQRYWKMGVDLGLAHHSKMSTMFILISSGIVKTNSDRVVRTSE